MPPHQRRPWQQLRNDALQIWQAGVEAVRSERLMREAVRLELHLLHLGDEIVDLDRVRRIAVVGAGKAGAGMAGELELILGEKFLSEKQVHGWVNVPADCVRHLEKIHLHAARPAGVNEPTAEGVQGAEEMLRIVGELGDDDLCICLISGGASALLPSPAEGITLADKLAVTRHLSAAGANIAELNTVRKQLSRIKGGRLAEACRAGRLVTLVISDVLGDPLDLIGSGPTVVDSSTPAEALAILERYESRAAGISPRVFSVLQNAQASGGCKPLEENCSWPSSGGLRPPLADGPCVTNIVIGNNARAVDAAGVEAVRLGYQYYLEAATQLEGEANEIGRQLAFYAVAMRLGGPDCLISGGEPVVKLAPPEVRGRGGRNQQVVLSALVELLNERQASGARKPHEENGDSNLNGIVILSGGTDGEDGPTDAAGAWLDAPLVHEFEILGLDPADHLLRNDAYPLFAAAGHLLRTGPTHTNVCDLRVVLVDRVNSAT